MIEKNISEEVFQKGLEVGRAQKGLNGFSSDWSASIASPPPLPPLLFRLSFSAASSRRICFNAG
jgi:hypothetical protein